MSTIFPTHTCFDDAIEYVEQRVRADPDLVWEDAIHVAHGVLRFPDGLPFVHAWVEEGPHVIQSGCLEAAGGPRVFFTITATEFAEKMRPGRVLRYTLRDVWRENRASGHYGPWDPALRAMMGGR